MSRLLRLDPSLASRTPQRLAALALIVTSALACGATPESPVAPRTCEVGTAVSASSAQGRRLLGPGSRYPADAMLPARANELRVSQRARRAAAWDVISRVLAPVALAETVPAREATVPRFRTWYDRDDVNRVFQRAFGALPPEGRAARVPFSEAALDEAFGWNVHFVDTLDIWPASRWSEYIASIHDGPAVAGVSGLRRIAVSPDAARHIVGSYAEVMRCIEHGSPPSFVDSPAQSGQQLAREPFALAHCATQNAGPFYVAAGATLVARTEGAAASGAAMRVLEGPTRETAVARCDVTGTEGCTVNGPGVFFVALSTTTNTASGMLEVRHTAPRNDVPGCLRGVFPIGAATVAMEWRRADIGIPLAVYDTSGPAIARRLATASPTWGTGDGVAEPANDAIYTLRLEDGAVFQLSGMHIRTRELDRWMNITMWWSPRPDEDFGADRAASVRALGGPWGSYKMCAAVDFDEGDPDPSGGFGTDAPSLAAALRAVHEGRGGPSWCSNPYIDAAPGLVRSNCIGCHQHAFSGIRPGVTVDDPVRYPAAGRRQVRNNFPADQFWGIDGGDLLASVFSEAVSWWQASH